MASITVNGKSYPLRADVRALMECEEETGMKIETVQDSGTVGVCTFLFYFARAAARHQGERFNMDRAEFLQGIELQDLATVADAFEAATAPEAAGEGKKKAASR